MAFDLDAQAFPSTLAAFSKMPSARKTSIKSFNKSFADNLKYSQTVRFRVASSTKSHIVEMQ